MHKQYTRILSITFLLSIGYSNFALSNDSLKQLTTAFSSSNFNPHLNTVVYETHPAPYLLSYNSTPPIVVTVTRQHDRDFDGIADSQDQCPNTPRAYKNDPKFKYILAVLPENRIAGPQAVKVDHTGCAPDTDHDGVVDHKDYCPEDTPLEISAGVYINGCPTQSDQDGTPDYRDQCPNTPMGVKTDQAGCPV